MKRIRGEEARKPEADLRTRAQERLRERGSAASARAHKPDLLSLVHELEVHRVELELQNEELQEAHGRLEEAVRIYSELYDFAPLSYVTLDRTGTILRANLAGADLLGLERAASVGRRFRSFVAWPSRKDFDLFLARVFGPGAKPKECCELPLLLKGDRKLFVRIEATSSAEKDVCRAAVVDLTDERRREEELSRLRTEAEDANRAKSDFLASMSHEIRTPLAGLLGLAELLRRTPLTAEQQEYVEDMASSGKLLRGIVDSILDFRRIEAGALRLETIEFDLRDLVEDTVHLLAASAHEKGLVLDCIASPTVPARAVGDPNRLSQVLLNLAGNAVKFTERGEVQVRVDLQEKTPQRTAVIRVEVSDTGAGIPADVQARLFQPFFQGHPSSEGKIEGSGLGLVIASRLVEAMGGEIGFRSVPGVGSTFWFTASLLPPSTQPEPETPFSGLRALAVVAHPSRRSVLMEKLKALGMEPAGTGDAREARSLTAEATRQERPFRLLLVERDLSGEDEFALARDLIASAAPHETGVVQILPLSRPDLLSATRFPSVTVPIRERDLRRAVSKAFSGEGPPEPQELSPPSRAGQKAPRGRVLLAEDNALAALVVTRFFEGEGFQVDFVGDGLAAVEAARRKTYDVVLMDWQMPGLDGLEATRRIRKREGAGPRVPILALTAHGLEQDREQCLAAGMDECLFKLMPLEELLQVVERWLKRGNSATPPGETVPAPSSLPDGSERFSGALRDLKNRLPPESVRRIVEAFAESVPDDLEVLRKAVEGADWEAAASYAHRIRGACLALRLEETAGLLLRLEEVSREGDKSVAAELVAQLQKDIQSILLAVTDDFRPTPLQR